jgi:hypothetical protein
MIADGPAAKRPPQIALAGVVPAAEFFDPLMSGRQE